MKQTQPHNPIRVVASRPTWGAWIETGLEPAVRSEACGRAPRGARGLKPAIRLAGWLAGVAPHVGRVD